MNSSKLIKTSICPFCDEAINSLEFDEPRMVHMTLRLHNGEPDYTWEDDFLLGLDSSLYEPGYRCSMCDSVIADNEQEAIRWLKKETPYEEGGS